MKIRALMDSLVSLCQFQLVENSEGTLKKDKNPSFLVLFSDITCNNNKSSTNKLM